MQLIKPSEISGAIMTLIEEADKKVILISPYFKIKKWYKLVNKLNNLKQRKIDTEIYVRESEHESIQEVVEAGFTPFTVPNLHTKLYINEKEAIVSSMNLLLSSDTNSLDIALRTENTEEYKKIWDYYLRYIKGSINKNATSDSYDWREELDKALNNIVKKQVYINESNNRIQINTGNRYEALIDRSNGYCLTIHGILSSKEYDFAVRNESLLNGGVVKIELQKGTGNYYNTAFSNINGLQTRSINELHKNDEVNIVKAISEFIKVVERIKKM